jgi:hypothetical protein
LRCGGRSKGGRAEEVHFVAPAVTLQFEGDFAPSSDSISVGSVGLQGSSEEWLSTREVCLSLINPNKSFPNFQLLRLSELDPLENHVINGLLSILFVCNCCFIFLHILLS